MEVPDGISQTGEAMQRTAAQELSAGKHLLEEGRYAYAWYRLNHVYDFKVTFPELESLLIKCEEGMGWPPREPEMVELLKRYLRLAAHGQLELRPRTAGDDGGGKELV